VGDDLFANCLIALNAETGERIWHFQGVRHDLWDRDFPSAPVLFTLKRDGKDVDAVAQTTKQGFVYLFERAIGKTTLSHRVSQISSKYDSGEVAASEQPLPTQPAPYARQLSHGRDVEQPHARSSSMGRRSNFENPQRGAICSLQPGKGYGYFSGFDGGAEWGGPAVDPETAMIYVNSNEMAWMAALAETPTPAARSRLI